jgi:hypothetical protein
MLGSIFTRSESVLAPALLLAASAANQKQSKRYGHQHVELLSDMQVNFRFKRCRLRKLRRVLANCLKAVRFFAPRVPLPQHAAETRSFSAAVFFKPRWVALLSSSKPDRLETKVKKG